MKYFSNYVNKYLSMLFPCDLEEGESIRLFFQKQEDIEKVIVRHVTSFDEVSGLILKYRERYNCFVSLATYKDAKPYKRHVLFLDYDHKDFPEFKEAKDFTAYFKSKIPKLYNHMIVLSGSGGCHIYIACEEGGNKEISDLNKRLRKIANADPRASTTAQLARIPGSYNLKHDDKPSVIWLTCDDDLDRYSLSQLDHLFRQYEDAGVKKDMLAVPEKTEAVDISKFHSPYYCVNNMLANGVGKGERNFALGRITACLRKELYTYEKSKELVLDWNTRCNPPKAVSEVERDFKAYWFNDKYKLLGCSISDERLNAILKKYCQADLCKQIKDYTDSNPSKNMTFLSALFFDNKLIKKLTSYQYAILLLLSDPYKFREKPVLLYKGMSECFSEKTIKKAFAGLVEKKLISKSCGTLALKNVNSKYNGDISVNMFVLASFIKNKAPSSAEFKVYLALRYLSQAKKPLTYDSISDCLGISKSTVAEHIKALEKMQIIHIEKRITEKGLLYNYYSFPNFDKKSFNSLSKPNAIAPSETTAV